MIPSTEVNHATVGRHAANLQMGIDPSAFEHLMGVLTNLYSNKALAVIREYSTNAYDSHVAAGCADRPIEVWLPVNGSRTPTFKVQDYGVGLSFDELRDVYAQYGASSKRTSNDVNGMLGLGCKSALTFASSFTITSVKDGNKVMAVISKNEKGIGAIKVLADIPTEEKNGVLIEVPVPAGSVQDFRRTASEFFRVWNPGTVLIDGKDPKDFHRSIKGGKDFVWLDDNTLVQRAAYSQQSFIIMGNVAYPMPSPITGVTVRAWVPIGAVDFVPSREALHMTEKTKAVINSIKGNFRVRLVQAIKNSTRNLTAYESNSTINWWAQAIGGGDSVPKVRSNPKQTFRVVMDTAARYKHTTVEWRHFERVAVVSGFPFKSVGPTHKARLREMLGPQEVMLFPPDTDLSAIEGHPRMTTWEEVMKATTKPAPQKRTKAVYMAQKAGAPDWHAPDFGTGAVVYYSTHGYLQAASDVWQVVLRDNQVEKFRRLHPLSKPVTEYLREKREKAEKALTDEDRTAWAVAQSGYRSLFIDSNFQQAEPRFDDPLVRRVIGLARYSSPTLTTALNRGVVPSASVDPCREIIDRYPLLKALTSTQVGYHYHKTTVTDDLITYMNAKFKQIEAKRKANRNDQRI